MKNLAKKLLIPLMMLLLLSGCAPEEVVDNNVPATDKPVEATEDPNAVPIAEAMNAPKEWKEEFESEHNTKIVIDAEINIPEVETVYAATAIHRYLPLLKPKRHSRF